MLPNNLSDLTKLEEVFFTSEEDLSHISQYGKSYHNSESSAKCPRCQNLSELVESGPVDRSTGNPHSYRLDCGDCGRFQRWIGQREFDRKIGKQGGRGNA